MVDSIKYISNLVENQFPSFYAEEGPVFIEFLKSYYEWMEQEGNTLNKTRTLFETRDIDTTATAFLNHFKEKYFTNIPSSVAGDKRFLQQHIVDLYRSKGSDQGLKLLFKMLYNEDINVYVPSTSIFKASDGVWREPQYFEISNSFYNYKYEKTYVTGATSGATAFVDAYKKIYVDNYQSHVLYITNVSGQFIVGEQLTSDTVSIDDASYILGSPAAISVNFASPYQPVGEFMNSVSTFGTTNFSGIVNETYDVTDGFINFIIVDGGTKYSQFANISVTTGANTMGYNAGFTGFELSGQQDFTYNTDIINYIPADKTKYFNPNVHVSTPFDFIKFANNTYFANGDLVKYLCAPGNTVLSGLANGSYYYIAGANDSTVQLASSLTVKTFNANSDVNSSIEFISIATNTFANGDILWYRVDTGNTALTNLANNSYYYAIQANSSGVKLATTYTPKTFNPKLAIIDEIDDYYIAIPSHGFANNDIVRYTTSYGNTAIGALANNTYYYVVQANTGGIKLSSSLGGAAINLFSPSLPSEDGHNIYGPGTPINLTKGLTQAGHSLTGFTPIDLTASANEFGHALIGRGVSFNANTDVSNTADTVAILNNPFANGDLVTYHAIGGNTAVGGLSNNTNYYVIGANDVSLRLSSNYYLTTATFNSNTGVNSTSDFITTTDTNVIVNNDIVFYYTDAGNTAVTGLSNGSYYYAVSANSLGLKLSSTYGGANINITASLTQTGHNLKRLGPGINLVSGSTETGHYLTGVSKIDMPLNSPTFGSSIKNANLSTVIDSALTYSITSVGHIIRLTGLNPGRNYDGDVVVRVRDNYIASYGQFDANGNIEGNNASFLGRAVRGNDIPNSIKIKDSGFGHNLQGENITLYNTANNSAFIDGNVVLGAIGVSPGFYENNKGKVSDSMYIHDNLYYQEYSYEIQFSKSLDKYVDILNKVMHPVGNKVFGKPVLTHFDTVPLLVIERAVTQA